MNLRIYSEVGTPLAITPLDSAYYANGLLMGRSDMRGTKTVVGWVVGLTVAFGGTWAVAQDKDAKPLISIVELAPGLRADEILGAEVRSSDDKIVGEVRNVIFGTKDRQDYAIVASGGFFTTGQDSFVVPMRSLKVSQERSSFFLPLPEDRVKRLPVMPDQDYKWLADKVWRAKNDVLFGG